MPPKTPLGKTEERQGSAGHNTQVFTSPVTSHMLSENRPALERRCLLPRVSCPTRRAFPPLRRSTQKKAELSRARFPARKAPSHHLPVSWQKGSCLQAYFHQ